MKKLNISFVVLLLFACGPANNDVRPDNAVGFTQPVKVEMIGYKGNIMEPFLTRDGNTLLFNNRNDASENTNLHYAAKINDTTFQYKGEIAGVNTKDLEGVPTLDNAGNLYFVSTRDYANTLSTLYQCNFSNGVATNVQLINGISKLKAGWVNFDVEVSADGQTVYFVDAQFDQSGNPSTADIIIAVKTATGFQRLPNSNEIMQYINTDHALEYAACISADQLELYFTRLTVPFTATSSPEILVSTRQHINEPFSKPSVIKNITGFAEAATISPNQKVLYYHKKENDKFVLYMIRKK